VVRHVSDQVGVMYLGRLVELADKHTLFDSPRHPYTRMLLDAIPKMHDTGRARTPVQGEVPNPLNPPTGCTFHPRCPHGISIDSGQQSRCRRGCTRTQDRPIPVGHKAIPRPLFRRMNHPRLPTGKTLGAGASR
jgi:oligopeptide/dipeptide ABC transporter ATP-binding protein